MEHCHARIQNCPEDQVLEDVFQESNFVPETNSVYVKAFIFTPSGTLKGPMSLDPRIAARNMTPPQPCCRRSLTGCRCCRRMQLMIEYSLNETGNCM